MTELSNNKQKITNASVLYLFIGLALLMFSQSNLSAEMAHEHRMKIGTMINDCYKTVKGVPGYEQTWGGTVPMFDMWKRGADPFDEQREMSSYLPDTPMSALIRSNGLNAMNNQPQVRYRKRKKNTLTHTHTHTQSDR